MFQASFKKVSWVFQESFKGISTKMKGVLREFLVGFNIFQRISKGISEKF